MPRGMEHPDSLLYLYKIRAVYKNVASICAGSTRAVDYVHCAIGMLYETFKGKIIRIKHGALNDSAGAIKLLVPHVSDKLSFSSSHTHVESM